MLWFYQKKEFWVENSFYFINELYRILYKLKDGAVIIHIDAHKAFDYIDPKLLLIIENLSNNEEYVLINHFAKILQNLEAIKNKLIS